MWILIGALKWSFTEKKLQFKEHLDLEVYFVKQYVESRSSKMPDLQTVLTSSGMLNPAVQSDAAIEQYFFSFLKLRKLRQKVRSFADEILTFYVAPYENNE